MYAPRAAVCDLDVFPRLPGKDAEVLRGSGDIGAKCRAGEHLAVAAMADADAARLHFPLVRDLAAWHRPWTFMLPSVCLMRIGILGSGLMGGEARHDLRARRPRGGLQLRAQRAKLERLARKAGQGARAGTPREAAQDADALLLAVHWSRVDDVLKQAGDLSGKSW